MLSAISKNVIVIQTHVISNQNDVISAGWSRPSLRPHCPPCKLLSFLHSSETYRILRWGSRNRKHDSPKVHGPASHPSILFPLQKIMVWLLPSWSCLTWTRLSPARSPGWPRSPTSAGRRTWSTSSGDVPWWYVIQLNLYLCGWMKFKNGWYSNIYIIKFSKV